MLKATCNLPFKNILPNNNSWTFHMKWRIVDVIFFSEPVLSLGILIEGISVFITLYAKTKYIYYTVNLHKNWKFSKQVGMKQSSIRKGANKSPKLKGIIFFNVQFNIDIFLQKYKTQNKSYECNCTDVSCMYKCTHV